MRGRQLTSFEQACGALPINGLLLAAGRHKLTPKLVSQCNSGDTAGDRRRVVGYAAIESDVVGYSAFVERDEEGTYAEFERLERELIEPSLSRRATY